MQKVVIVIPIYKKEISDNENASLTQCINILGNYPIIFVCPNSLDTAFYEDFCKSKNISFKVERFKDSFFKSLKNYSKLLLTKEFYNRFLSFEFMLLYQLDAWIFENKLEYWCDKNYDYIGAPWFEGFDKADENSPIMPISGNGGFSLRKISSILKVLNVKYKSPKSFKEIYNKSNKKKKISKILNIPIYLFKYFWQLEHFATFWEITDTYEDCVFATYAQKAYKDFQLAPPEISLQFSFEAQPKRLYEMNNKKLPFGCHAFEKYDYQFWKPFIKL